MTRWSLILLLALCYQIGFAQVTSVQRFTMADGLPFTESTHVFVDSKGYLWISSSNGSITRYDGKSFTSYTRQDHTMDSFLFNFCEDEHGVWAYEGGLGDIRLFKDGKWMRTVMPNEVHSWVHFDETGVIAINRQAEVFDYDSVANAWERLYQFDLGGVPADSIIRISLHNNTYPVLHCFYSNQGKRFARVWSITDICEGSLKLLVDYQDYRRSKIYISENETYKMGENEDLIFSLEKDGKWIDAPVRGKDGLPLRKGNSFYHEKRIFIQPENTSGDSDWIYELTQDGRAVPFLDIEDRVLSMTSDKNGNLWFASHGGLLKVRTHTRLILEDDPGMVNGLHCIAEDSSGKIWFGGYRDGFTRWNGQELKRYYQEKMTFSLLPGTFRDSLGYMYFWNESAGFSYSLGEEFETTFLLDSTNAHFIRGYYMEPLANGRLALGTKDNGVVLLSPPFYDPPAITYINKRKGLNLSTVLAIQEDRAAHIWVGSLRQGIGIYDPAKDSVKTWRIDSFPEPGIGALSMDMDERGNIWLGTNKGIYLLKEPHKIGFSDDAYLSSLQKVSLEEAGESMVTSLKVHKRQVIFSNLTGHGILDIDGFYRDPNNFRMIFFNTASPEKGGAGEQNTILIDREGKVWIGKDFGAVHLDLEKILADTFPVKMSIPKLMAGDESVTMDPERKAFYLPVSKRSIRITVDKDFNGSLEDNVTYSYLIQGAHSSDTSFVKVGPDRTITLDYLPPGRYSIKIRASRYNLTEDKVLYSIIVPYAPGENPWTWLMGVLVLLVLGAAGFYYRVQAGVLRKKAKLEKKELAGKLQQARVKALTSSLNPHFMNNALNWLQYKIQDDPEAVALVGRLSENIRTIFLHSRNGRAYHSLGEELRLVENYLLIQRIRYGQSIKYRLPDAIEINKLAAINVPLMQVLIHVENSIEHGIRNRREGGTVDVEVTELDEFVYITVTDDGIGRPQARERKSYGTQQGTKMLRELRHIFNDLNEQKIQVKYEDTPFLNPNTNTKYGTVVHIYIPKHFSYGNTDD